MKILLTDDLGVDISRRASRHTRLRGAISYVTADHLKFGRGDVLVCDASQAAIQGGLTSASLLLRFLTAGAEVYSYPGLHSKIAVFNSIAMIGSANLSANAGVQTCEASLLTDDPQIDALALAFIETGQGRRKSAHNPTRTATSAIAGHSATHDLATRQTKDLRR